MTVRFSNGSGNPEASDAEALEGRGMATKFYLPGGTTTDIVALSLPVFFVRNPEEFLEFMEGTIRDSGLPPEILCFELTETSAVSNLARADKMMQRLRSLGCSFALDDFGTGLSSLVYLKSLPVSVLKIDGAFVRDAGVNPRTESMVRAMSVHHSSDRPSPVSSATFSSGSI